MRMKKFISLALALVMALALAVPAMAKNDKKGGKAQPSVPAVAVDKIEDTDQNGDPDPRLPLIEAGAEISIAKYSAIYIKQANDVAIIVQAGDTRSDEDIIAEARASDKSLAKEGKGTVDVLRGAGSAILHRNTTVTVANGVLTILGTISHASFVGGDAPTIDELQPDDGTVSAVFQINKYLNEVGTPGAGFTFEIIDSEGNVVGTMTSDANGEAKVEIDVEPGTYTIHETDLDLNKYEAVADLTATVDENGDVTFSLNEFDEEINYIINYELGALEVATPTVMQKYDEVWHTPVYQPGSTGTMVSHINDESGAVLPACISNPQYMKNGFTWFQIDTAALATQENGVNLGIALSDKGDIWNTAVPDIAPEKPWEDSISAIYNLKMESGKLVVTSTIPNFRVTFSTTGEPNHTGGHVGEQCYTETYDIPAEVFNMAIHTECPGYNTDIVTGCDSENVIFREMERVIDPGQVAITVTNAADEVVSDLTKLPHGQYTVIVSVGDEIVNTQTVTVEPGKTAYVSYNEPLYMEKGADEYHCKNPDCILNTAN